ncbi:MAG: response regulator [Fimbriimonadaceae bacterium]|nr:response regulator [Chitinophagales bacterium]
MHKKETVFIVDDEPMHAQMMEDYLKQKFPSFTIYKYSTGEECNENMDKNPGIIILDYHLNAIDKSARNGAQILEHIRRKYEDTVVIMISGQDKIEVAVDCMRVGAYDYITKNETAFIRTENAISRLFQHRTVVHNMKKYRRWYQLLMWGILVIVAGTLLLTITGALKLQ